jgi:hypothetical protein
MTIACKFSGRIVFVQSCHFELAHLMHLYNIAKLTPGPTVFSIGEMWRPLKGRSMYELPQIRLQLQFQ